MNKDQNLLTEQQYKIACLAATGMKRKDIADELQIGLKTVDTHLSIIYRKLNIRGSKELPNALKDLSAHKFVITKWQDTLDFICNNQPMTSNCLMNLAGCKRAVAYNYLKQRDLLISERSRVGLKKLADKHNKPYTTVWNRVARLGWDIEDALNTPVSTRKCK
jgi:DNA-binding CsgD family transcriptional regulator